ncbi:MAG TPA: DUF433 domain-containing protein [Planctomycetaceae bacterium]|jgi:uncharacterized protein (DUF433 family)|nr:DUF433 domain-containing protein [Planctomycetaceae bacterium]
MIEEYGLLTREAEMDELTLLQRISVNPEIFGGKPIIRGRRLAVEHVLSLLAAGDTAETILEGYPWMQKEDIQACLVYARRHVGNERIEPLTFEGLQPTTVP